MLIKSFGCSFIFGADLADQIISTDNGNHSRPSQLSWPALFSKQQGHYHRCYAQSGSGNLAIADRVLREVAQDVTALFIVGWTWVDRFDYIDKDQGWSTIRPGATSDVAKTYYQELHSETRDKLASLMSIRTVIDSLRERNFSFIMTYQDELLFDRTYNTTPTITTLQDYVEPYMTQFEGKTFLNWSRERGYPESDNWHPLEQAHVAGAELMVQMFGSKGSYLPGLNVS
jgi:hypothetical protein